MPNTERTADDLRRGPDPRRAQRHPDVPARAARRARRDRHGPRDRGDRARAWPTRSARSAPPIEIHVMEDYGPRPMLALPPPIAAALERADVSIYAGQPKQGELAFRRALTAIIDRRQIRHAHMVSISHRIMVEAMRAELRRGGRDLVPRARPRARRRRRSSRRRRGGSRPRGDVRSRDQVAEDLRHHLDRPSGATCPGGEVLTAPARVDGVYVVDGVVGDYLCARYGDLEKNPLTVTIENSRIVDVQCDAPGPRRRLPARTRRPTRTPTASASSRSARTSRVARRHRQHPAGREAPDPPHRVRPSLLRAHRRARGGARRTSTSSAAASTSGSTTTR